MTSQLMTVYEHAMLGATLALTAGVQRWHGWRIVALAGLAAALPDWDGLTLAFGAKAYAAGHRTWGHNVLACSLLGALAGAVEYRFRPLQCLGRAILAIFPRLVLPQSTPRAKPVAAPLTVWMAVGMLAALSHLPADLVFSGHPELKPWEVPLLWPFSRQGWVLPIVPWGDVGATVILVAEMFALARWPDRAQAIAALTLTALIAYVGIRWAMGGIYG